MAICASRSDPNLILSSVHAGVCEVVCLAGPFVALAVIKLPSPRNGSLGIKLQAVTVGLC